MEEKIHPSAFRYKHHNKFTQFVNMLLNKSFVDVKEISDLKAHRGLIRSEISSVCLHLMSTVPAP